MTTELTKRDAMLPTTFEEIQGLASAFEKSGYFNDVKGVAQAIVKIQAGKELGLSPIYSMQNINMIRGRLTSSANTLALLIKRSNKYNYKILEWDDTKCIIEFYEDGKPQGKGQFTIDDAKRAGLIKPDSGWMHYPKAMVFSRAISQGARAYCPDAIGGMYTDEEMRSIPPKAGDDEVVEAEIIEEDTTEQPEPPAKQEKQPQKIGDMPEHIKDGKDLIAYAKTRGLTTAEIYQTLDIKRPDDIKSVSAAYAALFG